MSDPKASALSSSASPHPSASQPPPSSVYATDHSAPVLRTHRWRTAANSAAYLLPHLAPHMAILDVGCGPGSISVGLARLVPDGHVTGIENVPEPLDQARALAAAEGVANVTFREADVHALPFADDSFDIVHAHQVLQHLADPVRALREMRRVVRPGGLVACRESASLSWFPDSPALADWDRLTRRIAEAKGGHPHPGRYIHTWAEQAGFDRLDVTCSAGAWCFSSDEEREYWGGSMADRVASPTFTAAAAQYGSATPAQIEGLGRGWDDFRRDKQAWFGLMHGQILCRK